MSIFARILVGVDDSPAAVDAVAFAARLANEHGGQLFLAHAVNWVAAVSNLASMGAIVDSAPLVDELKADGERALDRAAHEALGYGVAARRRSIDGEPAATLLGLAEDERCTLIVMGTHGRTGLDRLFLGSTTETLLRASTIPVLIVRAGAKRAAETRRCFASLAVGIDESEPAAAALETVLNLPPEDSRQTYFFSVAGTAAGNAGGAQRAIARATALARERGVWAKGQVIEGHPAEALIAFAQQRSADLIVLGSHGRDGIQRLLLGSVAENVARRSPLPVLVVRTRVDAPAAFAIASS